MANQTATPVKKIGAALQDGWMNLLAAIGVQGKDKRVSHGIAWVPMAQNECDSLYAADDSAQKVVDEVVDDGTREWICLKNMDEALKAKVMAAHDRLQVREKFAEAWRWARLYGGSAIIPLFTGDSNVTKLMEPLSDNPGELKGMLVVNRYEIHVDTLDDDIMSPNFGFPKTYTVSPQTSTQGSNLTATKIHYTRVLRFDGAPLPRRLFVSNNYWNDSVLNRAKDAIRDYNYAFDSANAVLGDFSVSKFKLKGLADLVAAGKEDQIKQRLEIAALSKSVIRAVAIDADGEDWEEVARSMTGVPEVMAKASQRMVAASKLPHTKMLGESPSGLGATGRSEEKNYYDYVKFRQTLDLSKNLDKVLRLIITQTVGGQAPEGWSWEFKSLWQLTELEEAERYLKNAQGDAVYLTNQVLDPSEVATSRFGGEDYSSDMKLTIGREAPDVTEETDPNAAPAAGAKPSPTGKGNDIQRQALNGAQVTSLIGVLGQVAIGNLPRETALGIMTTAFPITEPEAQRILGTLGNGFEPADPGLLVGGRAQVPGGNTDEDDTETPTAVRSLLLSKERFKTEAEARQWAAKNGYKTNDCVESGTDFMIAQNGMEIFDADAGLEDLVLSEGVKISIGKKKV